MKKAALLLLLCVSFVHAAEYELPERDRIVPTLDRTNVEVQMYWYETKEDVDAAYQLLCAEEKQNDPDIVCRTNVRGFTILVEGNYCEIYAVKPKYLNDMETIVLGHEFLHCLLGAYHE